MDRLDFAEVKNTVGVVGTGLRPLPLGAAEETIVGTTSDDKEIQDIVRRVVQASFS